MTDTLEPVAAAHEEDLDQEQLAQQLLAQAKEQGVELVGPDGLLNQLTKRVLETALEEEMSEHLGYDKHDPVGRNRGNSRNGVRSKTVLTEIGPGRDRRAPGHRREFRSADRQEATTSAHRSR